MAVMRRGFRTPGWPVDEQIDRSRDDDAGGQATLPGPGRAPMDGGAYGPQLPGFDPSPPTDAGPWVNPGNPEGPRPSPGASMPGRLNQPGGISRPGATPSRPGAPTPVATQPPRPFTPISPPRGVMGSAMSPSSGLLGKAGGLLGGGLGVPGIRGGGQDVSSLIAALLARLGR